KELNIFHSNDPLFFNDIVSVSTTVETPTSIYLQGTEKKYTGAFALVENVLHLQDIPNAIIVNERNETRFKFEIEKFNYLRLRIYDSLGREIYQSRAYSNDFDTKGFSSGTYYYYLEGELLNGQKVIKNDILEIIRTE
ncbi:gliding motility-associated C-terminal domain-containing protein, partial [Labilibaculum sp. K2S]|uniref:T9SS type B sorting domain-containing protein n=1 Tax=Labilibaculum sp. K2S TaxID=3056386 RepID=UPI0025A3AA96